MTLIFFASRVCVWSRWAFSAAAAEPHECAPLLKWIRGVGRPVVSGFSQPGLLISLLGLGNYPQDPSAYGPTRPSLSYGQDEQGGYSAGRCQHRLLQPQPKQHCFAAVV